MASAQQHYYDLPSLMLRMSSDGGTRWLQIADDAKEVRVAIFYGDHVQARRLADSLQSIVHELRAEAELLLGRHAAAEDGS